MKVLIGYAVRRIGETDWRFANAVEDSVMEFMREVKEYREHEPPLLIGEEYVILNTVKITAAEAEELDWVL